MEQSNKRQHACLKDTLRALSMGLLTLKIPPSLTPPLANLRFRGVVRKLDHKLNIFYFRFPRSHSLEREWGPKSIRPATAYPGCRYKQAHVTGYW